MPGTNKLRIAYIMSLPHSGSTILAHHLSKHRPVVNLGEAGYGMRRIAARAATDCPCACGKSAAECDFWGGWKPLADAGGEFPQSMGYHMLVDRFRDVFGNESILLDANKTSEPIRFFCEKPDCEVHAIHLVRDFRGACVSEAARKKNAHPERVEWFTATQAAFQWMRKNLAITRLLDSLPLAGRKTTSYEQLCQNPKGVLRQTTDWLGANQESGQPNDHTLIGNRLGFSSGSREISYDSRWRNSRSYYPAMILFPILPLLNRRWVYS
jgi:hypothetical protein